MAAERFFFPKKKEKRKKRRVFSFFILLCALLGMTIYLAEFRLLPILGTIALSEAEDLVTLATSKAITDALAESGTKYEDIVSLARNEAGDILAIETDIVKINLLQVDLSAKVVSNLGFSDITIGVPLGNAFSDTVLTGVGPEYKFKVLATTSVYPRLENIFTDAGINQTRHQIMLRLTVPVTVVSPGRMKNNSITVSVCIAETIIVGKVPDAYTTVNNDDRGGLDQMLDYDAKNMGQ